MRKNTINRVTNETNITATLNIDGSGKHEIDTGIGFFDHMLTAFTVHSGFDLQLTCIGDLQVDSHHTIEDIGIVLGSALNACIGDKSSVARYGNFTIPMDEALATVNLDISNRPFLVFNVDFNDEMLGSMQTQMVREFFYAVAINAGITLHINLQYGENDHHICEAIFKAFAHALRNAVQLSKQNLTSKGVL